MVKTFRIVESQEVRKELTPSWRIELPTHLPCQIYPRVSTKEQIKNVSAEMQQDRSFAIKCGWEDTAGNIIVDTSDLGKSGQLRMAERQAFKHMLRRIENREIGAVVACNVDRLFRNKWGDEYGRFMQICHDNNVIVVTPDFVYDFKVDWHIDRFKRRCEEAWNYLLYHIYGRMLKAVDECGRNGFWAGGSMPTGFAVDMREKIDGRKNGEWGKLVAAEPYADLINEHVFWRLKKLHGNVRGLFRELCQKAESSPLFPAPEPNTDFFIKYALKRVDGGFIIASESSIRDMLTNVAYIGWWVYKGELISKENHPAIVDYRLFEYAYNSLSLTKLDGSPNPYVQEKRQKYAKRFVPERPAYLNNCIETSDESLSLYATPGGREEKNQRKLYYIFSARKGGDRGSFKHTLSVEEIDRIALNTLRQHLLSPEAETEFKDFNTADAAAIKEAQLDLSDIDRDIRGMENLRRETLATIKSGRVKNPEVLGELDTQYTHLGEELIRLKNLRENTSVVARRNEERKTYRDVMKVVGDEWEHVVMDEDKVKLVRLFIHKVIVDMLSPQFFALTIKWLDNDWNTDHLVCYRNGLPTPLWTKEEDDVLAEHWLIGGPEELMELLPRRSWKTIRYRAWTLKLDKKAGVWGNHQSPGFHLSWLDHEVVRRYSLNFEDISHDFEGVKIMGSSPVRASLH